MILPQIPGNCPNEILAFGGLGFSNAAKIFIGDNLRA
jgi:hypothetical protein